MKAFAVVVALGVVFGALVLSFVFLWGITKQIVRVRDKHHADALFRNAQILEEAGYLEAAEQFRTYARYLEATPKQRKALAG